MEKNNHTYDLVLIKRPGSANIMWGVIQDDTTIIIDFENQEDQRDKAIQYCKKKRFKIKKVLEGWRFYKYEDNTYKLIHKDY